MTASYQMSLEQSLFLAISEGDIERIKSVIEKGANIHAEYDMVLDYALAARQPHVFWFMAQNYSFDYTNNYRLLKEAAALNHVDIMVYLIEEKKVDPNLSNNIALLQTASNNHLAMAQYLVKNGADMTVSMSVNQDIRFVGQILPPNYHVSVLAQNAFLYRAYDTLNFFLTHPLNRARFFSDANIETLFTPQAIKLGLNKKSSQDSFIDLLTQLRQENPKQWQRIKREIVSGPYFHDFQAIVDKIELASELTTLRHIAQPSTKEAFQYKI